MFNGTIITDCPLASQAPSGAHRPLARFRYAGGGVPEGVSGGLFSKRL